jgi:hypothetical protein
MSNWYTKPSGGWSFSSVDGVLSNTGGSTNSLHYAGNSKTFFTNKTYLYKTKIKNLQSLLDNVISIKTPWGVLFNNLGYSALNNGSPIDGYINFYSSPKIRIDSLNNPDKFKGTYNLPSDGGPIAFIVDHVSYLSYTASFTASSGILEIDIKEMDWNLHGYSWIESAGLTSGTGITVSNKGKGWSYNSYDGDKEYFEYFGSGTGGANPASDGLTNSTISQTFSEINHLSRYIEFNFFNLYFETSITGNGFKIYLSDDEPYVGTATQSFEVWKNSSDLIASYTQSVSPTFSAFFGLKGNKYISFVADNPITYTIIRLSELRIEGDYGQGNNRQYLVSATSSESNFESSGLSGVTFSSLVGIGDTYNTNNTPQINQIFSKIGNGTFKAGMWENGVWNNGWRFDESVREFDDIDLSIRTRSDVRWRFRITGPSASVSEFKIGDEITIGNIVAIDINEKRRFIKDRFRIIGINPNGINTRIGFIIVEVDTTFPIRRIEKDSKKHKIKITKNGWLSGAFLNGYFTGVWNFGLFKGYPLITEMFNTNWIDGVFDGGHFQSEYYISGTFSDVIFRDNKVGLTFSQPHKLVVGDIINIEMDEQTINQSYNGETRVSQVLSDNEIVTDIDYGIKKLSGLESGKFTAEIATSVIQNMDFNSNNISKTTSIESLNTEDVFIYNSWIDVNYSDQSAVNIGRPQTKINEASRKSFSENNLYGYPTDDILSSESKFRDSYTLTVRDYKLGNKWKLFNDYVGESSKFTEYFGTSSEDTQLFIDQGWTFSNYNLDSIKFSRTDDDGTKDITGEELKVEAILKGGVLDISQPSFNVDSRNLENLEKNRYTVVEFDLVTHSIAPKEETVTIFGLPAPYEPFIHFNNINKIKRSIQGFTTEIPTEYLPIYKNIEHTETKNKRKVEFFFNKRNLSMNFTGSGVSNMIKSEYILNNLKIFETDMIPFFQYFIDVNINKSIQIPFQGIAPYIDYEDSDFLFIDNINIGLDSIKVESTNFLFTGVGIGIISSGLPIPTTPTFNDISLGIISSGLPIPTTPTFNDISLVSFGESLFIGQ